MGACLAACLLAVAMAAEPQATEPMVVRTADGRFLPVPGGDPLGSDGPLSNNQDLYRMSELPSGLRTVLGLAVQAVLVEEAKEHEYQKSRTRQRQRFVDIPAPTINDLKRTRRRRVWSMTEQYELAARLDGPPLLEILRLAHLKPGAGSGASLLWLELRCRLPVAGRVHYEIPGTLSATTGYRAAVGLTLEGHVALERSGGQVALGSPSLSRFNVAIDRLDISNDLLNALRGPIEDVINHELRQNRERIREKANQSVTKALQSRQFSHPLLRLLAP